MLVKLQKYHSVYILLCIVNAGKLQKYHSVYILLCIVNAGKTAEISFSIHFTVYSRCW